MQLDVPENQDQFWSAEFSPNGRWFAACLEGPNGPGKLFLWELTSKMPTMHLAALPPDHPRQFAFSPDGERLATVGFDRVINIWDVGGDSFGQPSVAIQTAQDFVGDLSFGHDNQILVAGLGNSVRVWNLKNLEDPNSELVLRGHNKTVRTCVLTRDGRWLATLAGGGRLDTKRTEIALWNLGSNHGQVEPVFLRGPQDEVISMHFVEEENKAISVGRSTVFFWELDLETTLREAKEQSIRHLTLDERRQYAIIPDEFLEYETLVAQAATLWANGWFQKSLQRFQEAVPIAVDVCRRFPEVRDYRSALAEVCDDIAWKVLTCPDLSVRNASLASELVRKAMEYDVNSLASFSTLALVHYREGRWSDSLRAASDTPIRFSPPKVAPVPADRGGFVRQSEAHLISAMANWQIGRRDDAWQSYRAGLARLGSLGDRGLAEEAQALLGHPLPPTAYREMQAEDRSASVGLWATLQVSVSSDPGSALRDLPGQAYAAWKRHTVAISQRRPGEPEVRVTGWQAALEFSGNGYVRVPGLRYDGTHPLTLEALVTPDQIDRPVESVGDIVDAPRVAIQRSAIVSNVEGNGSYLSLRNGRFRFVMSDDKAWYDPQYTATNANSPAQAGRTFHVAGVYDGRFMRLYVDGRLQKQFRWVLGTHIKSDHDFFVGAEPDDRDLPHKFFKGTIDEVRISSTARYTGHFDPPTQELEPDEHTLVLYHFNEGEGEIASDSSGNGRHGKLQGGATWVTVE